MENYVKSSPEYDFLMENVIYINGHYDLLSRPDNRTDLDYSIVYETLNKMNRNRLITAIVNRSNKTEIDLSEDTNNLILRVENDATDHEELKFDKFYAITSYISDLIIIFDEYNITDIKRIIFSKNFFAEYKMQISRPESSQCIVKEFNKLLKYFNEKIEIIYSD